MKKLIGVKQQTNNKYVNMFVAHYKLENNNDFFYEFASRKSFDKLVINTKEINADAVRMIPYFYENGEMYIVLVKEFRHAVEKFLLGTPAGLIDPNEDEKVSVARELEEEIGATTLKVEKVEPASFSSVGLSDEAISCFEAEVVLNKKQELSSHEEISIEIVHLDALPHYLDTKEFALQSRLQLRGFYYKQKYLQTLKNKKELI